MSTFLEKHFAVGKYLSQYNGKLFRQDFNAAATLAFVALPQSMAYALIAGVDPEYGLYAFMIGSIFGSLFGSSRHLQTGPTNATSIIVASTLALYLEHEHFMGLVFFLGFISGVIQLAAGYLRLGNLTQFLSRSVLVGFIAGAGLLIGINQIPNLLGLPRKSNNSVIEGILHLSIHIHKTELEIMAIGVGVILLVLFFNKVSPKTRSGIPMLPSYLIAILTAAVVVMVFELDKIGVKIVGDIPGSLPPLSMPYFNLEFLQVLTPGAIAIALIGFAESTSAAKTVAAFTNDKLDMDREFKGQGIAKIACSFFSGIPVSGSLTRTQLCYKAGAETHLANIMAGGLLVVVVMFFSPLVKYIPLSGLAGIVLIIAASMVDWKYVKLAIRSSRADTIAMAATFLGAIMFPLDTAIYIGVGISLALFLRRVQTPRLVELNYTPDGHFEELRDGDPRTFPEISVVNIAGDVFFGAVDAMEAEILRYARRKDLKVLILRLKRACCLDATSITTLMKIFNDLKAENKLLLVSGATDEILDIFKKSGLEDMLGPDKIFHADRTLFHSTQSALHFALKYLKENFGIEYPIDVPY